MRAGRDGILTPLTAFIGHPPSSSQLAPKTRRKYRDREKIGKVCNERTMIRDNQRVESFNRESTAKLAAPILRSYPVVVQPTLHPYLTPLYTWLSTRFPPPRDTRARSWCKLFQTQENDFLVAKTLFRENTERETFTSHECTLRAKRIESIVFESACTATLS